MAKSPLTEQLEEIKSMKEGFPQYEHSLDFNQKIIEAILPIEESLNYGFIKSFDDRFVIELTEKTLSSRKPMNYFLKPSFFDTAILSKASKGIISYLISLGESKQGLNLLKDTLNNIFEEGLRAVLEEDFEWFNYQSKELGVEASLLLLIFDSPLRPFFEELSRRVEKEFIEIWWEPYCPVCGRESRVARMREGKRYLVCTYCGCQYLTDRFICPICGNNDPTTQGFIGFPSNPAYELNFCEVCNKYIKVIYEERMKRRIHEGLEDLLTRELDVFAESKDIGLSRT